MMTLSDGEITLMIHSAVDTIHTCDGRTDRRTDGQTELARHIRTISIYAVARKNQSVFDEP